MKLKITETDEKNTDDIYFDMTNHNRSSTCDNDLKFCGGYAKYNQIDDKFESFGK